MAAINSAQPGKNLLNKKTAFFGRNAGTKRIASSIIAVRPSAHAPMAAWLLLSQRLRVFLRSEL
jgi:hypothetical protein